MLALFFIWCFAVRDANVYAITLYPAWLWTLLIILFGVPFLIRGGRWLGFVLAVWLVLGLGFSEEPRFLIRGLFSNEPGNEFLVSLNCAGGSILAAEEALASRPTLALLQESPSRRELEGLALKLGYQCVAGIDGSIVAKGSLTRIELPRRVSNFTLAVWKPDSVREIVVVSARLQPPRFRVGYWNPEMWSDLAASKRSRRAEMEEIVALLRPHVEGRPVIFGGDFNTPPDRTITAPLDSIARDCFAETGAGWCGTAVNEFPLVRIDQVWMSRELTPVRATVQMTVNSDHRLVRVELHP